jgi:hypothetical protein
MRYKKISYTLKIPFIVLVYVLRDADGGADEVFRNSKDEGAGIKDFRSHSYIRQPWRSSEAPEFNLMTEKLQKNPEEIDNERKFPVINKNYVDFNIEYAANKSKQTSDYREMRKKQMKREEEKKQLTKTILMANDYKVNEKLRNNHNCVIGLLSCSKNLD